MGRIIAKRIRGMNWMAKVSLILIFTLVFSTFMYQGWYKPKFSEAAAMGDGQIVYGNATATAQYRNYTASSNTFGAAAAAGAAAPNNVVVSKIVSSPTRNEHIMGYVTTLGTLYIKRWTGAAWVDDFNVVVGGTGVNGRRFDLAYENTSGDCILVYGNNAAINGTTGLVYRVWNGSTWAPAVNFGSARITGTATWIKMESRPGTDEIAIIVSDSASDLTAKIWTGAAWGSEPTAALSTTLEIIAAAGDADCFDLAYESTSGDLLIVWADAVGANGTNGVRYATRTAAGTWTLNQTPATFADDATNLDLCSDPDSNYILFGSVGNAGSDSQHGAWDGTAWVNQAAGDTSSLAPVAGSHTVACGWLKSGATTRGIIVYSDGAPVANGTIDFYSYNPGTGFTLGTDFAYTASAIVTERHVEIIKDPFNTDRLMVVVSDSASDLWAKRVVMDATPAFTWTDADAGTALTATLTGITAQAFSFAYDRVVPFFSFSSATYTQAEGNSGTVNATITVNRTGDTSGTNAVSWATSDGTATTADNDYVAASGTLTFNATETSKTFTVTINGDTKYENNETINLSLSSPTNGAMIISPSTATATITNDDSQPSVAFNSATSTGYAYDNRVIIPVSLSGVSSLISQVTYNTANGTAVAGTDYTAVTNGVLIFQPDETTKYITIALINNASINGKTFSVTLSGPVNVTLGAPSTNTVTIQRKYSSSLSTCAQCHAYPLLDGTPRNNPEGAVGGDHQPHSYVCSTCHVVPATQTSADFAHRNGNINMKTSATGISSGYYDKDGSAGYNTPADDTWAQTNSPATATCRNISCHGGTTTPQWGVGTVDCTGCHNVVVGTRRAVMGEFSQTWNHSAANAYDCGVCHMEGAVSASQTTGKTDPAYHGNGTIELRDPNTGTTIQGVTWSGPNAGSYTSTGSAVSFTQFSRNLNSSTLEAPVAAITINHCLHCHDGTSVVYAPGGSTTNPFASVVAPLDVDAHFNTTKASYHPVKGKQNNSYADTHTMAAPWDYPAKTGGQLDQWGYLMSCFDCHAAQGAAGTQTSTVVAHGGATTLRADYTAAANVPTPLCVVCHKQSVYWGSGTAMYSHVPNLDVSGLDADAATPVEWTNGGYHDADSEPEYTGCTVCHGTTTEAGVMSGRATGPTDTDYNGLNVHGFDTLSDGISTTWTSGARPWAFLRFGVSNLDNWDNNPATCDGSTDMCGQGGETWSYVPGGVF